MDMFKDHTVRTAFGISVLFHMVLIAPFSLFSYEEKSENKIEHKSELSYILIPTAEVSRDKEVFQDPGFSDTVIAEESGSVFKGERRQNTKEIIEEEFFELVLPEENKKTEAEDQPDFEEEQNIKKEHESEQNDRFKSFEQEKAYLKYHNIIRERVRAEIFSVCEGVEAGRVLMVFTLAPNGRLMSIDDIFSDDLPDIKRKAVKGIKKSEPFPGFPEEMGRVPITFSLTIYFTSE
ncbi:MAG: hypothetical protein ABH869_03985 [Candidatus Omnitrophota bacterium]